MFDSLSLSIIIILFISGEMQALCVTSSLMLVAQKTVSFLWFESQKIIYRKEPWSPKVAVMLRTQPSNEEIDPNTQKTTVQDSSTPFLQPHRLPSTEPVHLMNSSMSDVEDNTDNQPTDNENIVSLPAYSAPPKPTTYLKEIKTAKISDHESLPENPAPSRPDSTNIGLPTRKIKKQVNGMEDDDALGKSVAFLWWFFFLFSRILCLAACLNFQPLAMLVVLVLHYITITSHLLHQTGFPSIYKVFIQLCLGYVFIFCFIEFRYKLKKVTVFYICYFSSMLLENIVMSLSWYLSGEWDGFWHKFVFTTIFGSCFISFLSMSLYLSILKPEVKVVYVEESSSPKSMTDSVKTVKCCMCIPKICPK